MTNKSISILGVVLLLLLGVYFLSAGSEDSSQGMEPERIFSSVDVNRIAKIRIEQSGKDIELALHEGVWSIPSRAQYQANPSKVRSLLLKILDLSSSQRIPGTEKGFKKLGLTEEALESGRARVRLYDESGEELEGIYLGDVRKVQGEPGSAVTAGPNTSGQYVRRTSGGDIFLVALPVMVSAELSNWLNAELLNVLRSKLVEVEQFRKVGDSFAQEFALSVEGQADATLAGSIEEGKKPHEAMIASIASGLENVSIIDVTPKESENVADLDFDRRTNFSADNAAVYEVWTAEKDGKYFAKIEVRFDQELFELLKNDAAVAAAEKKRQAEAEAASKDDTSEKKEGAEEPVAEVQRISAEELDALNSRFGKWIYTLAEFQAQKFRRSRGELIQEIKTEDTAEVGKQAIESAGG